jgi:hypothetical protein
MICMRLWALDTIHHAAFNKTAKCTSLRALKYAIKYTSHYTRLYTPSLLDLRSQGSSQVALKYTSKYAPNIVHSQPTWLTLLSTSAKWFLSGRTGCVRAVRDTPVADYSTPGVNTTRRVAYRPPIAGSPFLRALSVSYFKQTLWHCGQLWPYVGMGSLCTHLHRDCNA